MCICKILFFLIFFTFLFDFAHTDTTTVAVDAITVAPECIKDKSKPSIGDNVQTCVKTSNDSVCCYIKSQWGCCPPGDSGSNQLPMIGGILGGITAALIIIVFFWKCCNREQMPCLGKVFDKMKKICPCLDRRAKPSSLTLPKESRKEHFTDDDFHGGPAWFFSDDPFATQGGARAIPQPPPDVDVGGELKGHENTVTETHTEIPTDHHDKNELVELGNENENHESIRPPSVGPNAKKHSNGLEKLH